MCFVCVYMRWRRDNCSLIVADDIHILAAGLLRRCSPAADVLAALPLLLSFRRLFLQLLPLVLRPAVLKPHLYLDTQTHTVTSEHKVHMTLGC